MFVRLNNLVGLATAFLRQCYSLFRDKGDPFTPEGRSRERYRRAGLSSLAAILSKSVSVLTMLISVPLTLRYLGTERYGMWMTIGSIVIMIGFADLGLGLGLTNAVSEAHGQDDSHSAASYVSSGFFMLSGIALLILAAFALAYPLISWPSLFNVKSPLAAKEAGPAMAAFMVCFAINLPLGVVRGTQMGYQESFFNSLWESAGKVLGLMALILVVYLKAGLVWLIIAVAGGPALAVTCNGLVLVGYQRPWLRPRWKHFSSASARRISHIGIYFFILQITATLAIYSDNLVAAQILGPDAVAHYSVLQQLFDIAPVLSVMLVGPLWPAYGEAYARGDFAWIKRTMVRSLLITIPLVGLPSLFLIVFGPKIIRLWVGSFIVPSFFLLLGFGLWKTMSAIGNTVAMFFNGLNIMRFQVVMGLFWAISALLLKIYLARTLGLPGIVWGTIITYALFCMIPWSIYIPRLFANMRQR